MLGTIKIDEVACILVGLFVAFTITDPTAGRTVAIAIVDFPKGTIHIRVGGVDRTATAVGTVIGLGGIDGFIATGGGLIGLRTGE